MTTERVTLFGLPLVEGRRIGYARVDRAEARSMFIEHALVEGDWDRDHDFVVHNRGVLDELDAIRARTRRGDLVADRTRLYDFYDDRIPARVATTRDFEAWWRRVDDRRLLDLDLGVLVDGADLTIDDTAFPSTWRDGDLELPLSYEFDPTSPRDGVTVSVPVGALAHVDAAAFEWNVPGLRSELVEALIRTLPKRLRTRFVPVPDTAAEVAARLVEGTGSLTETLRVELGRLAGEPIPVGAFDLDRLPHHLRPRFEVIGDDGRIVAEGTELGALRTELGAAVRDALAGHPIETPVERSWVFGTVPREIALEAAGGSMTGYPALVDHDDGVALRVLPSRLEQADAMWLGLRRLLRLSVAIPVRALAALLSGPAGLALTTGPYTGRADWIEDCLACALDALMVEHGAPVWTEAEFDRLAAAVRSDLRPTAEAIGRRSLDLLHRAGRIRTRLDELSAVPAFEHAVVDATEHLDRLVRPGFLTAVGAARLPDLDRYVRAIAHRLERLPDDPRRDADATVQCRRLEEEYAGLADALAWSVELEDVAWMLEEHRVSRFAESIGVKGPVSAKRIRGTLQRLAAPATG